MESSELALLEGDESAVRDRNLIGLFYWIRHVVDMDGSCGWGVGLGQDVFQLVAHTNKRERWGAGGEYHFEEI